MLNIAQFLTQDLSVIHATWYKTDTVTFYLIIVAVTCGYLFMECQGSKLQYCSLTEHAGTGSAHHLAGIEVDPCQVISLLPVILRVGWSLHYITYNHPTVTLSCITLWFVCSVVAAIRQCL